MKIKALFIKIGTLITALFFSVLFVFNKKNKKNPVIKAQEKEKEIEDEIKNTPASTLVDNSPNKESISTAIEQHKSDYKQRIRDRLNKEL